MATSQLDQKFLSRVKELQEQASTAAKSGSLGEAEPRDFQLPRESDFSGDPSNPGKLTSAFDRKQGLNDRYEELHGSADSDGKTAEVMAIKMQIAYLASMERGLRARHSGHLRCLIHADARRRAMGLDNGIFADGMVGSLQDMLKAVS